MREILQKIGRGKRVLLFLDYDGTLVPIKESPEHALLPPAKRRFLKRLGERSLVTIVSGRALSDIRRLIDVEGTAYIGNHGLEISWGQRHWVHPQVKKTRPILRGVLRKIRQATRRFRGVLVEDKGATATVHYRRVDPDGWSPLRELVRKQVEPERRVLKISEGKRTLEIKPNLAWNKGKGIQELLRWLDLEERPLLMYLGDDQTDEDAFKVINGVDRNAVTIHVGGRDDTHARFRLADVSEVWRLLRALSAHLAPPASSPATAVGFLPW
jgi:trehalose 6-phosphate phosphatase